MNSKIKNPVRVLLAHPRTLFLMITMLSASFDVRADDGRIILLDGKTYDDARLYEVSVDSAFFMSGGTGRRVPIDSIARIQLEVQPNIAKGVLIGIFAGGALGYVSGLIVDGIDGEERGGNPSSGGLGYPEGLLLLGTCAGGIAGGSIESSKNGALTDLTRLTREEKMAILQDVMQKRNPQ
jgi:hypothetical protein